MRAAFRVLIATGLTLGVILQGSSVHAQRSAGLNTAMSITISSATKTLDLGSGDSGQVPSGWTSTSFDDSAWTPAVAAASGCTTSFYSYQFKTIGSPSALYWGDTPSDKYLFRQDFTLPSAKGYYGSTADIGVIFNNSYSALDVYVNGHFVDERYNEEVIHVREAIGQYLHSGQNVLAIEAPNGADASVADSSDVPACGALNFVLALHITDIQTGSPHHTLPVLATILPGQDAVLSGSRTLPFSWHPVAHASYYYLQFWLVNLASGSGISRRSVTTFTTRMSGTSYNLNTHLMPKGVYHWRMVAVGGLGKLLTDWTPEQSVTLK